MAYVDIAATEARGMFSPPNGNDPQTIPDLWRPSPGEEIRTDLPDLTDAELNALDWKGPIAMPPASNPGTSYFTHSICGIQKLVSMMQQNLMSMRKKEESTINNFGIYY
jgi:hypothetical protein